MGQCRTDSTTVAGPTENQLAKSVETIASFDLCGARSSLPVHVQGSHVYENVLQSETDELID